MTEWAAAYLITCLVEVPLLVALLRGLGWRARRAPGAVLLAWLLQCTHPVLWLVHPREVWAVAVAEAVVVLVEAAGVAWWAVRRAEAGLTRGTLERSLLVAVIANAASLLIGLGVAALDFG
ncbi:MAG: hypothetical protein QM804_14180 [Propionicimonas sp.]